MRFLLNLGCEISLCWWLHCGKNHALPSSRVTKKIPLQIPVRCRLIFWFSPRPRPGLYSRRIEGHIYDPNGYGSLLHKIGAVHTQINLETVSHSPSGAAHKRSGYENDRIWEVSFLNRNYAVLVLMAFGEYSS